MATFRNYEIMQKSWAGGDIRKEYLSSVSNSVRTPDGAIDLSVSNPHVRSFATLTSYRFAKIHPTYPVSVRSDGVPAGIMPDVPIGLISAVEQIALAKYKGNLKKGRASLGVSLGSWKQSAGMISNRLGQANRALEKVYRKLKRDKRRVMRIRKEKDPLANLVLETEFGWRPLISDIHNAFGVLGGKTLPIVPIKGTHQQVFYSELNGIHRPGRNEVVTSRRKSGDCRVTISALAHVSNPNLFLAENLGLVNPFLVAWDLIPWSFVVGMFVNVSALLSSLTDELGLTFTSLSTTRTVNATVTSFQSQYATLWQPPNLYVDQVTSTMAHGYKGKYKERIVGTKPAVSISFRIPELNREQLLIAASLVLQKFAKINKLIAL